MTAHNAASYAAFMPENVRTTIAAGLASIRSDVRTNSVVRQAGLDLLSSSGSRLMGLAVPYVLAELTNPRRSEAWRAMLARAAEAILDSDTPSGATDRADPRTETAP